MDNKQGWNGIPVDDWVAWFDVLKRSIENTDVSVEIRRKDGSFERRPATSFTASGHIVVIADEDELERMWDKREAAGDA